MSDIREPSDTDKAVAQNSEMCGGCGTYHELGGAVCYCMICDDGSEWCKVCHHTHRCKKDGGGKADED